MNQNQTEVRIIKGEAAKTGRRVSAEAEALIRRTELEERKKAEAFLRAIKVISGDSAVVAVSLEDLLRMSLLQIVDAAETIKGPDPLECLDEIPL